MPSSIIRSEVDFYKKYLIMGGKCCVANCKEIYHKQTKVIVYRLLRFLTFSRFIET